MMSAKLGPAPAFKADHAFMIAIVKNTNTLFLGHILNPNSSAGGVKVEKYKCRCSREKPKE